ncbi:hypothetical protein B0J13DRAFT_670328 [Dactylonectria estremocensis]|uniref:RING-type domain-containing protein n=1 Tax=Dactylonectria estremocensis TaxID=1079267 RepID=A0A9P9FD08_9HYPO|nr:hypothetical protein B0J13DRAFT_670328 [Dactylonectria estremocensis]
MGVSSSATEADPPSPTDPSQEEAIETTPEQVSFWPRLLKYICKGDNSEGPLQAMCCVCYEELSVAGFPAPVREDGQILKAYINPCGHILCRTCLNKLRKGKRKSTKCPACREHLYCHNCERPPLMVAAPDETENPERVRYALKTIPSGGYFRPRCSRCFPKETDRDMNVWMLWPDGMEESEAEEEDDSSDSGESEADSLMQVAFGEEPSDSDAGSDYGQNSRGSSDSSDSDDRPDQIDLADLNLDSGSGSAAEPSDEEQIDTQVSHRPPDPDLSWDSSNSEDSFGNLSDVGDLSDLGDISDLADVDDLSDVGERMQLLGYRLGDPMDLGGVSNVDELVGLIYPYPESGDAEDDAEELGDDDLLISFDPFYVYEPPEWDPWS